MKGGLLVVLAFVAIAAYLVYAFSSVNYTDPMTRLEALTGLNFPDTAVMDQKFEGLAENGNPMLFFLVHLTQESEVLKSCEMSNMKALPILDDLEFRRKIMDDYLSIYSNGHYLLKDSQESFELVVCDQNANRVLAYFEKKN